MKLSSIIFDMDGVLVDSEPLHLLSMQTFLSHFEIKYSEEENQEFIGRKDMIIAQILIDRYSLNLSTEKFIDSK